MDAQTRHLIQTIHDCDTRLVLVTAGAGTQALSDLLGVAGASRTLLEALVPYSEAAFDDFLGQTPDQYVHAQTAKLMAGRALTRARWLAGEAFPLVGLACTATIITDRPKKGAHRAHIATWQPERLTHTHIQLHKSARNRVEEEDVVSRMMLNAFATACGLEPCLDVPLLAKDKLNEDQHDFSAIIHALYRQKNSYVAIHADGPHHTNRSIPPLLLCGSFNPLHEGHLGLARTAVSILNQPIAFELSAINVDKPPLQHTTVLNRVAQFAGRWSVYVTNAPTFTEKARLFPGAIFVVGYDTAVRILHPRYYDNNPHKMIAALQEIQMHHCRFLVAGRVDDHGFFHDPKALEIPAELQNLFISIPANQFRNDISSTELRSSGQKGSR